MRRKIEMPLWYALVAIIVCFGVMIAAGYMYTNYVDKKNRRGLCDLVIFIDNRNHQLTPTTDDQRRYIKLIEQLRERQGCNN